MPENPIALQHRLKSSKLEGDDPELHGLGSLEVLDERECVQTNVKPSILLRLMML